MKRREFITIVGGAGLAWPLATGAQQPERIRRIGVLMPIAGDDPEASLRTTAFTQGLHELGWIDGRNVQVDYRWTGANSEKARQYALELTSPAPDVIFALGNASVAPLLEASRTVPIVFAVVPDPVGAGFVNSLARPGGNATGLILFEYGMSAKWLELLKQIAPSVTRVAVMRDPSIAAGIGQYGAIQSVAPSFAVELTPLNVHDAADIERGISEFASAPKGGLIVTASPPTVVHRRLIIALAAREKLPAVYFEHYFTKDGGLVSYGPNIVDQCKRVATFVDKILKGSKPADLPVQAPTKYDLVINLKTAKLLDLNVPPALLAIADQVIE
jgi:putative tryptophan/tyrosine transport system substrate-binding protein